jgi:hypothetical protein
VLDDVETERENAEWRVREFGLCTELVRRARVVSVQERMNVFYAHAVLADVVALDDALRLQQDATDSSGGMTLVECLLTILRIFPEFQRGCQLDQ